MTRFRIVAVTAAAVIALAAWWVPLKVGGGDGCPGGGVCVEEPPASRSSDSPDRFYGGDGMDRIREGGDRPDTREGPGGGDVIRCGPNRYGAPTDAGEERPRSCEDVRARLY
jgi:hypothetical protein